MHVLYTYIFPPMWPNGSFCTLHRAPISGPGPALSNSWPLHGSQQHPHGAWRARAGSSCRFCGSSLFASWSCSVFCGRWSASLAALGGAGAHPLCNLPGACSPHRTGEWGRDSTSWRVPSWEEYHHADHCVGAEYFEVSDSLPMGKFLYPLRQVGNGISHVGAVVLAFEVGKMARHLAAG